LFRRTKGQLRDSFFCSIFPGIDCGILDCSGTRNIDLTRIGTSEGEVIIFDSIGSIRGIDGVFSIWIDLIIELKAGFTVNCLFLPGSIDGLAAFVFLAGIVIDINLGMVVTLEIEEEVIDKSEA